MAARIYRLEPCNKIYDIQEGLQARIKDPLFMLGTQWRMEEFRAKNGGQPVRAYVKYQTKLLDTIWTDEKNPIQQPIKEGQFLEQVVETENNSYWNSQNLNYKFTLGDLDKSYLMGREYDGEKLDWYTLSLVDERIKFSPSKSINILPAPIKYYGMPSTRWWSFEEGNINLADITRPQVNILTMLVADHSLFYAKDWYSIPLTQEAGSVRKINYIKMVDSFAIATEIQPVTASPVGIHPFEVFTLSKEHASDTSSLSENPANIFYLANTLSHTLESPSIEEVSFMRDEMSNMVWAIERKVTVEGKLHNREEEEGSEQTRSEPAHYFQKNEQRTEEKLIPKPETFPEGEPGNNIEGPVALYIEKQVPPKYWIPYVPRIITNKEEMENFNAFMLRRACTSTEGTQYKGKILAESISISEGEIPNTTMKIMRLHQLARDSHGKPHGWSGRKKRVDFKQPPSTLQFDQLIEP